MSDLKKLYQESLAAIAAAPTLPALEEVRVAYLGKKGKISEQFKLLGTLPPEEKKSFGAELNTTRDAIAEAIEARAKFLNNAALNEKLKTETIDITLPPEPELQGKVHPLTQVMQEMLAVFADLGFSVADGPVIEDEEHNFNALNIPPTHPARQMHDTFYLNTKESQTPLLLRTHTSPVQIRAMRAGRPPFRLIAPGPVFRCDSDPTHTPMFHQIEALVIDRDIHMGHLKGCIEQFVQAMFEVENVPVRFRPSFFPFTEPSAEVDIGCSRSGGELKIGAGNDWLEIMGCGMVHPEVLKNGGLDPNEWQGFAFGIGIDRVAMLKYGIPDLRTFFDADIRWLRHYGFDALDIPNLVTGLSK